MVLSQNVSVALSLLGLCSIVGAGVAVGSGVGMMALAVAQAEQQQQQQGQQQPAMAAHTPRERLVIRTTFAASHQ